MRNFRLFAVGLALAMLVSVQPSSAQQQATNFVLSNTTLNGAVTATQQTVVLASASASAGSTVGAPAVGDGLFVESEFMVITAVNGTTMTVRRGVQGIAGTHPTGAIVLTGDQGYFMSTYPANSTCTAATVPRPWVNVNTADVGLCLSGVWVWTNWRPLTWNSVNPY